MIAHPVYLCPRGAVLLVVYLVHGELEVDAALPEGAVLGGAEDRDGGGEEEGGGGPALLHPQRGRGEHLQPGVEPGTPLKKNLLLLFVVLIVLVVIEVLVVIFVFRLKFCLMLTR